ncbi:MAG: SMP-30/gluconolactonase/LRE family protein [Chloroflexota bacterium]
MNEILSSILETTEPERLATGFEFTEGPTWHPDGYLYFSDIWPSRFYKLVPGGTPELVREQTGEGNGTTFDLEGRVIVCEGGNRRLISWTPGGTVTPVVERFEDGRLSRPNDVICASDGSLYFTDPGLRLPLAEREQMYSGVYRVTPDGAVTLVANCEYPNGLAFSPDERTLYVSNTRFAQYIHAFDLAEDRTVIRRRIFSDMSSDETDGVPDGMKVDSEGNVFCTGAGGTWVFTSSGAPLGIIRTPEVPANLVFGGPDLRTIYFTARTSIYSLRARHPGLAHPLFR